MNIQSDSVRLMSFNILYDYGADKPYSWQSRREYVFSLLRFHTPDVFCLQEPLQNQVEDLANYFNDFLNDNFMGAYLSDHFPKLCDILFTYGVMT